MRRWLYFPRGQVMFFITPPTAPARSVLPNTFRNKHYRLHHRANLPRISQLVRCTSNISAVFRDNALRSRLHAQTDAWHAYVHRAMCSFALPFCAGAGVALGYAAFPSMIIIKEHLVNAIVEGAFLFEERAFEGGAFVIAVNIIVRTPRTIHTDTLTQALSRRFLLFKFQKKPT